jgi:hypothetical protein
VIADDSFGIFRVGCTLVFLNYNTVFHPVVKVKLFFFGRCIPAVVFIYVSAAIFSGAGCSSTVCNGGACDILLGCFVFFRFRFALFVFI